MQLNATIPLQTAFLAEHRENSRLFEVILCGDCEEQIRTENGECFLFKAPTEIDRIGWEVTISYAIRLVKFDVS